MRYLLINFQQVFAKKSSEGTSDGFSWFDAEVMKLQIKSNYENN